MALYTPQSPIPNQPLARKLVSDPRTAREQPSPERQALAEDLVDLALAATRQGSFDALVRQRPRAAHWMLRHLRPVLQGTAGDALGPQGDLVVESSWLLRWALTQLRPDREPHLLGIDEAAWLQRTAWRPMLAVMCHAKLGSAPDFPRLYRRSSDESPAENLCGLWDVSPSTFYRYLERGQRAIAGLSLQPPTVQQRAALREFIVAELGPMAGAPGSQARAAWHCRQVGPARRRADPVSALWHTLQADDVDAALDLLRRDAAALAGEPEADFLLDRLTAAALSGRQRFDLALVRAVLARTLGAPERELAACEQALSLAEAADEELLRGVAFNALARCHQARDAGRAMACYRDALRCLRASDRIHEAGMALTAYLDTLVRLAHAYVLRNEAEARVLLDEADALVAAKAVGDDVAGLLEQAWAEFWRRNGEPDRALAARLRALNRFERIGDRRSTLSTCQNLIQHYADAGELELATSYARRILAEAARHPVEPQILIATHGNLGYAFNLVGRYEAAIEQFRRARDLSLEARHEQFANLARHNLASACYYHALHSGDRAYEAEADEEIRHVLLAPAGAVTPSLLEEARGLKAHVLGRQPERSIDRLLDADDAAHLAELSDIRRQRVVLAQPGIAPADAARARLAVAQAYMAMASRERDSADALIQDAGLQAEFEPALSRLGSASVGRLSQAQRLALAWRPVAAMLDDAQLHALLERLLRDGTLSKSSFGDAAGVAPATASKHLAQLTQRGLLLQTGRGPATRYRLPDASGSPGH